MPTRLPPSVAKMGAFAALIGLAACDGGSLANRSLAPIPSETLALMSEKGVAKDSPILIRAFKKESELEIWKMRPDGSYVHLKTYPMCRWSGQLGPKVKEGDRQVPEGFYSIGPGQLNPNSNYYLSFNVGYPNAYDRALGRTGGTIMVHGACSSAGCFSMTDPQIAEIYAIARTSLNAGQTAFQMQSYPFRMTPENLAKHRLDPNIGFWRQLKEGNDRFEVTKKEPSVAVCGRRYVFGAANPHLDPEAPCPALKRDPDVDRLVAEKAAKDDAKVAELTASGVKPIRLVYQDGGQHPYFASNAVEVSRPELLLPPTEIALEERPAQGGAKTSDKARLSLASRDGAKAAVRAEAATPAEAQTKIAAQLSSAASADWMGLHREPASKPRAAAASAGAKDKEAEKKTKDGKDAKDKDAAKKISLGALSKALKEPQAIK